MATPRRPRPAGVGICWLLGLILLAGCASVPGQPPWGSRVEAPDWNRLGQAAVTALKDPLTWGPAGGAVVMSLGDLDREVSDWAREEQPLFGTEADRAGDWLLGGAAGLYLGSGLLADSGNDAAWRRNKLRGLGVGAATNLATAALTYGIKQTTRRERPDASDRRSFPSGHSSLAAANAALAARNLAALPLTPPARSMLQGTGYALAFGTAWSRIEAGRHYPTDALAGLALGNFLARLATESLLSAGPRAVDLDLQLNGDLRMVRLRHNF